MSPSIKRILLVDGAHCDRLRKILGTSIDFAALLALLEQDAPIALSHYHRDLRDVEEGQRQQRFLEWLSLHGFAVIGADYSSTHNLPRDRYGTNLVGLAVDALALSQAGDELLLLAGDVKLVPLVAALTKRGVAVTLVSTLEGPASISPHDLLVSECSRFIELNDYRDAIARVQ